MLLSVSGNSFFAIHAGVFWPEGLYEQLLAAGFWLVSLTGIVGVLITIYFPKRLTNTGLEIVYEKIPEEIFSLRDAVEGILVNCANECGETTLQEQYTQTLAWYFRRPRFYWSYLIGSNADRAWLARHLDSVRRYLNADEMSYPTRLKSSRREKPCRRALCSARRNEKVASCAFTRLYFWYLQCLFGT